MSEWFSYNLSDFLLFSPRVYARMFELHNEALWPLHIIALILSFAIVWFAIRPDPVRSRFALAALGGMWGFIGYEFLIGRYAQINPYAFYGGYAFIVQGGLLVLIAILNRFKFEGLKTSGNIYPALLLLIILSYPLQTFFFGKPLAAAQMVGIMPDPTALFTGCIIALMSAPRPNYLLIIPIVWIIISVITLHTLGSSDWISMTVLLLALVVYLVLRRHPTKSVG